MHLNKLADQIKQVIPSLSLSSALVSLQKVSCCLHVTTEKFTQLVQMRPSKNLTVSVHLISYLTCSSLTFMIEIKAVYQIRESFFLLFRASKNSMNTTFTQLRCMLLFYHTQWRLEPLMWLPGIHEILGHQVLRVLQH